LEDIKLDEMAKEVAIVYPEANSEEPERGCGKLINQGRGATSCETYPGTDVYLGRKEGRRLVWKCWRIEERNDCGRNVEARSCITNRRGKGTDLSVPSTQGGRILLANQ
jgi:hypothetical protein